MIRFQHSLAALFGHALIALAADAAAQTLEFSDALRAAEVQSPRLAAQRHALSAAREQVARATELPDPKLRLGIENLPISGADQFRYDRDFMTMRSIGWMQEFPNGAKRAARGERAARLRDVEQANLAAQNTLLRKEAATAWLEAYYAERVRAALARLAGQFSLQIDSVAAGIARGRQQAAEGYALRQVMEQANDRVIEQERAVAKARIQLAAWVGEEANKPLGQPPDTSRLAHPRASLTEELARHPQLQVHDQRENLARAEVELARSSKSSDWSLEVGYGHRRPAFENMLTVMLAFELPLQADKRQDRDIASRLAEVERARSEREDARRMHEAEVRGWLADFDTAQRRIQRAERVLLPLARERREAALAAYRGARAELGAVLEAERSLTEAELVLVQSEAERARAWASLSFLFPHGDAK